MNDAAARQKASALPGGRLAAKNFDNSLTRNGIALVGYAAVVFLIYYLTNPSRPGITSPLGWYQDWADQTAYYSMFNSMPHGALGTFQYPPVYPFFGVLGGIFYFRDPLLPVDLLLFCGFVWLSWRVFLSFLPSTLSTAAAALLIHSGVKLFVQPWSSTVSAAGEALLIYIYIEKKYSRMWGAVVGLTVALIFGARPQDAVAAVFIVVLCLAAQTRNIAGLVKWSLSAMIPLAVVTAAVLWTNYHFSHHLMGPYFQRGMSQGFNFAAAPRNLYGYFWDPWKFAHELQPSVLQVVPLLPLVPAGLFYLAADRECKPVALAFGAVFIGWFVAYGAFYAVNAETLKYGSVHYAKLLFPSILGSGFYAIWRFNRGGPLSTAK